MKKPKESWLKNWWLKGGLCMVEWHDDIKELYVSIVITGKCIKSGKQIMWGRE